MKQIISASIITIVFLLSACKAEEATAPKGSGYDFLVLSLSWSPTYCKLEGDQANRQQCATQAKHAFVVHGLWPQFENGWPEFCNSTEPKRVPDDLVKQNLDLMPSASLIGHQWRKHGSCSGLKQRDYFKLVRAAWNKVKIPAPFTAATSATTISPSEVGKEFLKANPDLKQNSISVLCDGNFISEVRICMNHDLDFRSCEQVSSRACRIPNAQLPSISQ